MTWEKKGLIFVPDGKIDWSISHAQLPIVDIENRNFWRIFYATRNSIGQSNIGYVDVSPGKPEDILYIQQHPLLQLGKLGTFDESGIMPVAIVNHEGKKYLYYAGWSLKKTVPYHNTVGLAISENEGISFEKIGEGPIFDSKPFEPYSNGTINILIENGVWRAWYQSITKWLDIDNVSEPFYHIKYAESSDGINWNRKGNIAIDYKDESEAGICSATVIHQDGVFQMWYCYRGLVNYRFDKKTSYKIGYAESQNGYHWIRRDKLVGIDISHEGWDNEMMAYPNVIQFKGRKFMFYNGNGFGRTGFGYAILK
jgi:hypothetical protein